MPCIKYINIVPDWSLAHLGQDSKHIFPSLGMAWDKTDCLQSSLHKGSEEAVRSSMLGLLSPIKHHIGSHESKKLNRPITTTLIYLRILGVRKKKQQQVFCACWFFQKSLPKMGTLNQSQQAKNRIDVSWRLLRPISQPAVDVLPDGRSSWKFDQKFTPLRPSQICFVLQPRSHSAQHPEPRATCQHFL